MPVKVRASGVWDIQVQIQGQGQLERVASLNHPVNVLITPSKTNAIVSLKPKVDRSLVPNRDFVFYIDDQGISTPTVVSTQTPSNQQAINLMVLPDTRSDFVKSRITRDIQMRRNRNPQDVIDMAPEVKYARNELEQM